ncbi:MAG: hypothetical protein AB1776_00920 [Bacillota bacterium]
MGERYETIRRFMAGGGPVRVTTTLPGGLRSTLSMVVEQVGPYKPHQRGATFILVSPATGAAVTLEEGEIAAVGPGPQNNTLLVRLDGGGELFLEGGRLQGGPGGAPDLPA